MTGPGDRVEETGYWRRWRAEALPVPPVDDLSLAAYAEGRLDEEAATAVEAWLADHPEVLEDVIAARATEAATGAAVPETLILRAIELVAPAGADILPFRPARATPQRTWRQAIAWTGIAASLLVTSLGGFELGSNAYATYAGQTASVESTGHELFDPPTTQFLEDEDPST
jgi:anti-sigma factor RsiW